MYHRNVHQPFKPSVNSQTQNVLENKLMQHRQQQGFLANNQGTGGNDGGIDPL